MTLYYITDGAPDNGIADANHCKQHPPARTQSQSEQTIITVITENKTYAPWRRDLMCGFSVTMTAADVA